MTTMQGKAGDGPLKGIKVLDFTRFQNGPSATRTLADYGAIVIKVEAPKNGDEYRNLNQMSDGYNIGIEFMNRGKKSLTLDIRKPEARPVMEKLITWCDVLCENYKPGTLNGYGYTYEECSRLNPGIIYCTNSGFGDQGPMGHLGSFDGVAQAFTGVMHAQGGGPENKPQPMEFAFSDEVGAMSWVQGILMALLHKARTGEGQRLDTSQSGATIQFQGPMLSQVMHLDGRQPYNPSPGYGAPKIIANQYLCSDGKYLHLQALNMPKLLIAIGRKDVADDPRCKGMATRTANSDYICGELEKTFATRPMQEWLDIIDKTNTGPAGPVNTYKDVINHEQNWANGYVSRQDSPVPGSKSGGEVVVGKAFKFSKSPAGPVEKGPQLGEHNDWVLKEQLGLSQAEVDKLVAANITTSGPPTAKPPTGSLSIELAIEKGEQELKKRNSKL